MKYINENPTKTEKILFEKYGLYLIYKDEDSYRYAPIHIENQYVYPSSVEVENDMVEWEHDIIHFLRREMLDFTAFPVFFVSNLLLVQRKKYYFNRAMVSRNCSIVL